MDHETGPGGGQAGGGTNRPDEPVATRSAAAPSGDAGVDEALRPLSGLAGRPVAEHPQVFERIHAELVEVLGELGSAAGPAG
jgi:hypothetical protein